MYENVTNNQIILPISTTQVKGTVHVHDHHSPINSQPSHFSVLLHMNITIIVAICGNLFLAFVIWRGSKVTKHRISPVQLLLLHTCLADILFAIFSLGTEVLIIATLPKFHAPDWVCKMTRYAQAFPMYASAFLLVAISADRYQAICRPLAHYRTDRYRRPNCLAAIAWLLALIFSSPQIYMWHIGPKGNCATRLQSNNYLVKAYVVYFGLLAWLIPSILAGIFYSFVCTTVWKSKVTVVRMPSYLNEKYDRRVSGSTREYIDGLRRKSLGLRNQTSEFDRKRMQTVRLTLTIIVCNFLLWAPYCLMNVFLAFDQTAASNYGPLITYILILGNLNSCVNPWIYILFNFHITKRAINSIVETPLNSPQTSKIHQNSNNYYFKRSSEPLLSTSNVLNLPDQKGFKFSMTEIDKYSTIAM